MFLKVAQGTKKSVGTGGTVNTEEMTCGNRFNTPKLFMYPSIPPHYHYELLVGQEVGLTHKEKPDCSHSNLFKGRRRILSLLFLSREEEEIYLSSYFLIILVVVEKSE